MKNVNGRFAKGKYALLSELGSKFNLSFSSHLELSNQLIAVDGLKRMLLVLETGDELNRPYVIDLNKIDSVSIKKSYGSIQPGELRTKKFDEFLRRIDLQFEQRDKNESIVLTFYDSAIDELRQLQTLERNAKNWQMILSKLAWREKYKIRNDGNKLLVV